MTKVLDASNTRRTGKKNLKPRGPLTIKILRKMRLVIYFHFQLSWIIGKACAKKLLHNVLLSQFKGTRKLRCY